MQKGWLCRTDWKVYDDLQRPILSFEVAGCAGLKTLTVTATTLLSPPLLAIVQISFNYLDIWPVPVNWTHRAKVGD